LVVDAAADVSLALAVSHSYNGNNLSQVLHLANEAWPASRRRLDAALLIVCHMFSLLSLVIYIQSTSG